MSTLENTKIEEAAFEKFLNEIEDNAEFATMIMDFYYLHDWTWIEKEYGCHMHEQHIDPIFDWLIHKDYEMTVSDPIEAAYFYKEIKPKKY